MTNQYTAEFFSILSGRSQATYFAVLDELYERTCGPFADYNIHLTKDVITSLIEQAVSSNREQLEVSLPTSQIFKSLEDKGWLENYTDTKSLKKAYKFTDIAINICQTIFAQKHGIMVAAQHANSVRSHLNTFIQNARAGQIDVNDIMSAARFSGFIVNDLNNMIHEIGQCRRKMISMMAEKNADLGEAASAFFEFIEVRFSNGIALSFSRDSVERYKHDIIDSLYEIQNFDDSLKADTEMSLRKYYPQFLTRSESNHHGSILLWSLDLIENQLNNATSVKLPELRQEVSALTDRALMSLRDIVAINSQKGQNDVFALASALKRLPSEDVNDLLEASRTDFIACQPSFHNPDHVRVSDKVKFQFDTVVSQDQIETKEHKIRRATHEAWEQALNVSDQSLGSYISKHGERETISLSEMHIDNYHDLLCALQFERVASAGIEISEYDLIPTDNTVTNPYFSCQDVQIIKKTTNYE